MDRTVLRDRALNLATMTRREGADADQILQDAEKYFDWLVKDMAPATDQSGSEKRQA